MNVKELKEMIVLMQDNQITELELEREGLKVKLKRGGAAVSPVYIERGPMASSGYPQPQLSPEPVPPPAAASKFLEVKSPMVGTFYIAPSPESPAFVEVGQTVEIGQVLCIVEAMKLMNEIKSEIKGTVREVVARNADPIEFGQVLFRIEPS